MLDDPSALSAAERTAFDAFRLGPLCGEDDYLITQDTLAKLIRINIRPIGCCLVISCSTVYNG